RAGFVCQIKFASLSPPTRACRFAPAATLEALDPSPQAVLRWKNPVPPASMGPPLNTTWDPARQDFLERFAMKASLPVINLAEAKFECIFGRGCDGICCHNGRPPIYPEEIERIDANLPKILPELRPQARAVIERKGYLSQRQKLGLPMLRVVDSWCVF